MFNKIESKRVKEAIINAKSNLIKIGSCVIAMSFLMSMGGHAKAENGVLVDHHSESVYKYHQRIREYKSQKKYNQQFKDLYYRGQIMIDDKIYPIEKFFIDYNTNADDYDLHLSCIGSGFKDIILQSKEKYESNGCAAFRDTTAFVELLESDCASVVANNLIIINNKEELLSIIKNWDGMIHNQVAETDAVLNKNILKGRSK